MDEHRLTAVAKLRDIKRDDEFGLETKKTMERKRRYRINLCSKVRLELFFVSHVSSLIYLCRRTLSKKR